MTLFLNADGWTYETFEPDTPARAFGKFRSFVELWQSRRGSAHLPARADFAFEDFAAWYGWISIVDVRLSDEIETHVRLWGTQLVELFQYDLTNRSYWDGGNGYDRHDRAFLREITVNRLIGRTEGPIYWQQRTFVSFATIRLPLSSDGTQVDKFLNLVIPETEGGQARSC